MATIVGLLTIAISSYLIQYSEAIYHRFEWAFKWMERAPEIDTRARNAGAQVVLFGYERLGETIIPALKKMRKSYVVADFNPLAIKLLDERGEPSAYGDAGNEDFLEFLHIDKAKLVISTIPDLAVNTDILAFARRSKNKPTVIVTARSEHEAAALYEQGANFVILPFKLGGEHFAHMLEKKKTAKTTWNASAKLHKHHLGL